MPTLRSSPGAAATQQDSNEHQSSSQAALDAMPNSPEGFPCAPRASLSPWNTQPGEKRIPDIEWIVNSAIDDLKSYQDDREQALRRFIQQELTAIKSMFTQQEAHPMKEHDPRTLKATAVASAVKDRARIAAATGGKEQTETPESVQAIAATSESETSAQDGTQENGSKKDVDLWADLQNDIGDFKPEQLYARALKRNEAKMSIWHDACSHAGLVDALPKGPPKNRFADILETTWFKTFSIGCILANTVVMAIETETGIELALTSKWDETPEWFAVTSHAFTIIFTAELLYRIVTLRVWFLVSPDDWHWNMFDTFLVVVSLLTDILGGFNVTFIRALRLFRIVRVVRVIRVVRYFRELRVMMLSIFACLASLAWALVFLAMIMFMVSIFILQGAATSLNNMDHKSDEFFDLQSGLSEWYGSLGQSMFTLLVAVLGGADWMDVRAPLVPLGWLYSTVFVLYVVFINIGVLNVLTGVFLSSAADFKDRDLQVQTQNIELDKFIQDLMSIFGEFDTDKTGSVDFKEFQTIINSESMQAYLASHGLEPTHSRLLWDLLDDDCSGEVGIDEFVMGLMRLKGSATGIDARTIQRSLGVLWVLMRKFFAKHEVAFAQIPKQSVERLVL